MLGKRMRRNLSEKRFKRDGREEIKGYAREENVENSIRKERCQGRNKG
jgi:hypothetical protein